MGMLEGLRRLWGGNAQPAGPSRESRLIEQFLGCECQYIPAGTKQKDVRARFKAAVEECAADRTIPVLISVSDNLTETLFDNAGVAYPDGDTLSGEETETIAAFRDALIAQCADSDAEEFFRRRGEETAAALEEDEAFRNTVWESRKIFFDDVIPEMGAFVDMATLQSRELLLAKIPAAAPWQVPAWLPMGGWNDCPAPGDMLSIARRWYEAYGAVICSVTSDELEFRVSAPPQDPAEAMRLAKEFYYFCSDRLTQYGAENSLATVAAGVTHSPHWYFWWD